MRWIVLAVAAAIAVAAVAIAASGQVRWRAHVVLNKATGRLPDVGWSDLLYMLEPGSGVYIEGLATLPNPYEVIENPRHSPHDIDAGRQLFARRCATCHGEEARGGTGGPSLHDRTFRQGRRPWALYRTITLGVPGTAMPPWKLPREEVWQLAAYIDSLLEITRDSEDEAPASIKPVSADDLLAAADHPQDWLMYTGSYTAQRHSSLAQVTRSNVAQLRVEWARQLTDSAVSAESSPIVRGSMMFITESPDHVHALDALTGRKLWTFTHDLPQGLQLCCGPNNRGVAVLGSRIFVGTLDAHLIALDANTGRVLWDVALAPKGGNYSLTGAPLAIGDMVVTGVAGGEYETSGFLDAYDAATGRRRWRFNTVPAPGERGSESWHGSASRTGGAPTWMTGSFDPQLRLIYWGVGNPHPNYYADERRGDNLYSDCVIAVEADTGRLRWYFQFTPHDQHDWDSAQTPVLIDAAWNGQERKLMAFPNRNGFYYLLDRVTGEFLLGVPFAKQTWAQGLDKNGRPIVIAAAAPTRGGVLVYPSVTGAANWWATAYAADLGLIYVPAIERGSYYFASPERTVDQTGETLGSLTSMVPGERLVTSVLALEATTGHLRWRFDNPARLGHGQMGGLLSTAGGLVFAGDLETFYALDAATGAQLWHFPAGGQIVAAPVTYEADGRQLVAVAAGHNILAFALGAAEK